MPSKTSALQKYMYKETFPFIFMGVQGANP